MARETSPFPSVSVSNFLCKKKTSFLNFALKQQDTFQKCCLDLPSNLTRVEFSFTLQNVSFLTHLLVLQVLVLLWVLLLIHLEQLLDLILD